MTEHRPYRGISIDETEFVYGGKVENALGQVFIVSSEKVHALEAKGSLSGNADLAIVGCHEVIPETVSQSTGKVDCDGVEIYGKDRVEFDAHCYSAEVVYYPKFAAYLFDSHNEDTRNNPQAGTTWDMKIKVIGNTVQENK